MLDRRRNEMRRQLLRDGTQSGIGHHGNLPDALVVIPHEAEMGRT